MDEENDTVPLDLEFDNQSLAKTVKIAHMDKNKIPSDYYFSNVTLGSAYTGPSMTLDPLKFIHFLATTFLSKIRVIFI